jgi:hypothetical protein
VHIHHDAGQFEYPCRERRCEHESLMGPGIRAGRTVVRLEGSERSAADPAAWFRGCVWAFLVAVGWRNEAAEATGRRLRMKEQSERAPAPWRDIAQADVRCEIVLDRKVVEQMSVLSGASLTSRVGEGW